MTHLNFKKALIAGLAMSSLTLGGCAQIGQAADGVWSGTKSVANFVAKPFKSKDGLRDAPEQAYAFGETEYEVEIFEPVETQTDFIEFDVVLYDTSALRTGPAASYAVLEDPRDAAFIKLNGESRDSDWLNCEIQHRGYLFITEGDFRLDPNFEVCMRNKGYVLSTEAGPIVGKPLTADRNGLAAGASPAYGYPKVNSYP